MALIAALPHTSKLNTDYNEFSDVFDNDARLLQEINGNISNANLASNAAISPAKLAAGTQAGQVIVTNASGVFFTKTLSGHLTISSEGVATIADSAVATAKIADGAVTSAKLADGSVTNAKIGSGAIAASKLEPGTQAGQILLTDLAGTYTTRSVEGEVTFSPTGITTISNGVVTSAKIENGTIATIDLADGAVTSAKIADATITSSDLASNSVTTAKIADAAVTSAKIANLDSTITSKRLDEFAAPNTNLSIGSQRLTNVADPSAATDAATKAYADALAFSSGSVTPDADSTTKGKIQLAGDLTGSAASPQIAAGAVDTAELAANAVTSAKIADGTIVAGDIATGAVTSAKILDGTIATGDIADSAVTSAKIADGTIATGDIANSAITSAKLASGVIPDSISPFLVAGL